MLKITGTIKREFYFRSDDLFIALRLRRIRHLSGPVKLPLTIGITTFAERFDSCLRPLVRKLSVLFPGNEIIVAANGHYNTSLQARYLRRISDFMTPVKNAKLIPFKEPVGLSRLWNEIIKISGEDFVLLLNDDLRVHSDFRKFIDDTKPDRGTVIAINRSWSHFIIPKNIVSRIGLFDEGFTEIGGEDDDYIARMAIAGISPVNEVTGTLTKRKVFFFKKRINSFGKTISEQEGGYSTLNTVYLQNKWETSDEPSDGAVEVKSRKKRFWKLRDKD